VNLFVEVVVVVSFDVVVDQTVGGRPRNEEQRSSNVKKIGKIGESWKEKKERKTITINDTVIRTEQIKAI
jgi:hypothetical protein